MFYLEVWYLGDLHVGVDWAGAAVTHGGEHQHFVLDALRVILRLTSALLRQGQLTLLLLLLLWCINLPLQVLFSLCHLIFIEAQGYVLLLSPLVLSPLELRVLLRGLRVLHKAVPRRVINLEQEVGYGGKSD